MSIVSFKIYEKRDDFCSEIITFPFLDGDVPRTPTFRSLFFSQKYVLM